MYPKPKGGDVGMHIVAFDLDGVLATPTWPSPEIGAPIPEGIAALKHYAAEGFEIIIFTSRPAAHEEMIWDFLESQGIADLIYELHTDKPRAAMYVDDRAVTFPDQFIAQIHTVSTSPRQMRPPWNQDRIHDETPDCEPSGCLPA